MDLDAIPDDVRDRWFGNLGRIGRIKAKQGLAFLAKDVPAHITRYQEALMEPVLESDSHSRHEQRTSRIAHRLHRLIQLTHEPFAFVQVGVGCNIEAKLFRGWYPDIKIVGADPCESEYSGVLDCVAISDHIGTLKFTTNCRALQNHVVDDSSVEPSRLVECLTLDAFLVRHQINETIALWIDADGSEYRVLLGAQRALELARWLYIEQYHDDMEVQRILADNFTLIHCVGLDRIYLKT